MIGASSIGPEGLLAPARRLGVEVAAVASPRAGVAAAYAEQHSIPTAYESYEQLLNDDRIDAVYISTAAVNHVRHAIDALVHGKHVLCEKPAALDVRSAQDLIATQERTNRVLMEGFHYRFHPLFKTLADLVSSGDLGPLRSIVSAVCGTRPYTRGSILHEGRLGGGALLHNGVYALHWSRLLFDAEPVGAWARHTLNPGGADSEFEARLSFGNDRVATILCSFDQDRPVGATLAFADGSVRVTGLITPHYGHEVSINRAGQTTERFIIPGEPTYDSQLREFLSRIEHRENFESDRGDDITSNSSALAALRYSAAIRRRIRICPSS